MDGQRAIDTATTSSSPAAARALSASVSARSARKASPSASILPSSKARNMKMSSLSGEKARRMARVMERPYPTSGSMKVALLATGSGEKFARLDGPLAHGLDAGADGPWFSEATPQAPEIRETGESWMWAE